MALPEGYTIPTERDDHWLRVIPGSGISGVSYWSRIFEHRRSLRLFGSVSRRCRVLRVRQQEETAGSDLPEVFSISVCAFARRKPGGTAAVSRPCSFDRGGFFM